MNNARCNCSACAEDLAARGAEIERLRAELGRVRAETWREAASFLEERAVTFRRQEDRSMYVLAAHDLRKGPPEPVADDDANYP